MSTPKEVYVIYGAKIDPALITEVFGELIDKKLTFPYNGYNGAGSSGKCGILYDATSKNYCVAGLCLGLDSDVDSMFLEIDKITLKEYFDTVYDFFIEHLHDYFPDLLKETMSIFVITHYH